MMRMPLKAIPLAKVVSPDGRNAKERMLRCVDRLGRSNTQDC